MEPLRSRQRRRSSSVSRSLACHALLSKAREDRPEDVFVPTAHSAFIEPDSCAVLHTSITQAAARLGWPLFEAAAANRTKSQSPNSALAAKAHDSLSTAETKVVTKKAAHAVGCMRAGVAEAAGGAGQVEAQAVLGLRRREQRRGAQESGGPRTP